MGGCPRGGRKVEGFQIWSHECHTQETPELRAGLDAQELGSQVAQALCRGVQVRAPKEVLSSPTPVAPMGVALTLGGFSRGALPWTGIRTPWGFVNTQIIGLPEHLFQEVGVRSKESHSLQVSRILMLLVWGPYFGGHCWVPPVIQ